jgi:hypothetical protein
MAERSLFWNTDDTGDGSSSGFSLERWQEFLRKLFQQGDEANTGPLIGIGGELLVSGTSTPLNVASGAAMVYGGFYENLDDLEVVITTPAANAGGHIVLEVDWTAETIRAVAVQSASGVTDIPALEQNAGTKWQIRLATYQVTSGGAITVTDARVFCTFSSEITSEMLRDLTIATADIADLAVTTAKINDLAVTEGKIGALAVTEGKIGALAVTSGKLGALSVIAGKIANGAVDTAARLANAIVTSDKLAANSVIAGKIATGGVSASGQLADGIVTSGKLGASAVIAGKIATGGVSAAGQLADGIVTFGKLGTGAVIAGKIATGGVSATAQIADGIVTPDKIANRTRTIFVQPSGVEVGTFTSTGWILSDAVERDVVGFTHVPSDFAGGMTIFPIVIGNANGNIRWACSVFYGGNGQAWNVHSAGGTPTSTTIVSGQRALLPGVSLASAAEGDYINIFFTRYGDAAEDTVGNIVYIVGFLVQYTADS